MMKEIDTTEETESGGRTERLAAKNISGKGCPVCGGPLVHAEGCLKCLYCGYGLCD